MFLLLSTLGILISCSHKNNRADWKKQETINKEDKTAYMLSLKEEFPYLQLPDSIDKYMDKFTFLDLDHDGDQDLIYTGESGAEPFCVRIFINKADKFIKVFDEFSNEPKLEFEDGNLKHLTVFQTLCCGENYEEHVEKWKLDVNKDALGKLKVEDYYVFVEHLDPKSYDTPYTVRITADANIRYSPKLNVKVDTIYKDQLNMQENIIANVRKDEIVDVLGEFNDENDGRTWLYVEVDQTSLVTIGDWIASDGDSFKIRGWISKKNTEKARRASNYIKTSNELSTMPAFMAQLESRHFELDTKEIYDMNQDGAPDQIFVFNTKGSDISNPGIKLAAVLINQGKRDIVFKNDSIVVPLSLVKIVAKGNLFTLEQFTEDGSSSTEYFATFRYDKSINEIVLHKYAYRYINYDSDKGDVPFEVYTPKDFGTIYFKDLNYQKILELRSLK